MKYFLDNVIIEVSRICHIAHSSNSFQKFVLDRK